MLEFILLPLLIIGVIAGGFWLSTLYVRVRPDEIAILVGKGQRRVLRTSGFRKPITEDAYRMSLSAIQVDVQTSDFILTTDYIPIKADANVTVKVDTRGSLIEGEELINAEGKVYGLAPAVENFVGVDNMEAYVRDLTQEILEGNLREIIASMPLEEMVTNRKKFAELVTENAVPDLESVGIEILTFNIQDFEDKNDTIAKLGAENEEEITKKAELIRTKAEEEKAIARARSEKSKHEAKSETEKANAEQNHQIALQKADLDTKRAEASAKANAAEELEKARQDKLIEAEKAEVARIKSENQIMIRENEAKASERIGVDNEFYARKREAEAILEKAKAEAQATKLKGEADAEAIRKRQEAMAQFSEADLRLKELETLTMISKNIAEPLASIDNITMYGGGGTEFMSSITQMMSQFTNAAEDSNLNLSSVVAGAAATKLLADKSKNAKSAEKVEEDSGDTNDVNTELVQTAREFLEEARKNKKE